MTATPEERRAAARDVVNGRRTARTNASALVNEFDAAQRLRQLLTIELIRVYGRDAAVDPRTIVNAVNVYMSGIVVEPPAAQ